MDKTQLLLILSIALFTVGITGIIIRKNLLIILMSAELMLNGVNLSLVTLSQAQENMAGAIIVIVSFVIAAAEIALAIPIVLLLYRQKKSLDISTFNNLQG